MAVVVDYEMTLVINGSASQLLSSVEPYNWNNTEDRKLYLGQADGLFFHGQLDEVVIKLRENYCLSLESSACYHRFS